MNEYPYYLENLIDALKMFPGIGAKSATRMALQMLDMNSIVIDQIADSIHNLNASIKYCKVCHNLSENDICTICEDRNRDQAYICVVANFKDIYALERMNSYNGLYHVLAGEIAINKGITPEKLNITTLVARINNSEIKEIIIATNPTIEGETTALYLSKVLADYDVKTSRLALGIPMGANIDYVDELKIKNAFENRKDYNNQ
jgi:recombination protein RecR